MSGAADVSEAIERFLNSSRRPELHEPGELPFPLTAGRYAIASRGGRWLLEVWDDRRTLARRVIAVADERPGRLSLVVEKFGKKIGSLLLADAARQMETISRHSSRLVFRETLRRFLAREFAGWKIAELSAEADLEHSLSPAYPRAYLRKGQIGWAAIGLDRASGDPSGVLTFGLIWLDYLRRREPRTTIEGLALFLPSGSQRTACLRIPYLTSAARFAIFIYSEEGFVDHLDESDYGNLDTRLEPCGSSPETKHGAIASHLGKIEHPEAMLELQVRSHLTEIDADLMPDRIYGQVPAIAGIERGVIDLLAVSRSGRLATIELKASEDIHLPLQALDYWMRVKWHLDRDEFTSGGYFRGICLRREPPRMLLVAPALDWHPTTETLLRYFSPEVEVERFGVGIEWQRELKVMFRVRGAERPR